MAESAPLGSVYLPTTKSFRDAEVSTEGVVPEDAWVATVGVVVRLPAIHFARA